MAKKRRSPAKRTGPHVKRNGTYRILLDMRANEDLDDLGRYRLDYLCMPQPPAKEAGGRQLHAYAPAAKVAALRKAGRKVKILADARKEGNKLQKFISKTDRFAGGQRGPRGVGKLI